MLLESPWANLTGYCPCLTGLTTSHALPVPVRGGSTCARVSAPLRSGPRSRALIPSRLLRPHKPVRGVPWARTHVVTAGPPPQGSQPHIHAPLFLRYVQYTSPLRCWRRTRWRCDRCDRLLNMLHISVHRNLPALNRGLPLFERCDLGVFCEVRSHHGG